MATDTTPSTQATQNKPHSVRDVSADKFIEAYARHLKRSGRINVPKWADIVKTGAYKEQGPTNPDWYYIRLASVARRLYLKGGLGVGLLRRIYGGRQNNGSKPSHAAIASGAVLRSTLKQLEAIKVVEKDPKGGRRLTHTGQRDLDRIASHIGNRR
ncbi:hypothetical protein PROFUN_11493 [Planoprotostelium fungivorum]|uniref:40S ribosomal protein S19 n=1 Tax=Planoprotostelium fungivorum TaxID=1890364 RepID=A0A2P6N9X9_9EUKA|nr:hypothetical protein PROFUN_11493 [Planoprotostelium fungivorum]